MAGRDWIEPQVRELQQQRGLLEQPRIHVKQLVKFVMDERFLSAEKRSEFAEALLKLAEANAALDQMADATEAALRELGPDIANAQAKSAAVAEGGAASSDSTDFAAKLEASVTKTVKEQAKNAKAHGCYTEIERLLRPSEDDVQLTHEEGDAQYKCPLTTKCFKKPVKSKTCSHTFEEDAILHHIRVKTKDRAVAKCPLCNLPLSANDLVPDKEKELDMRQYYQRTQQSKRRRLEDDKDDTEEVDEGFTYVE